MNTNILESNLGTLVKTNTKIYNYLKTLNWNNKEKRYALCESKSGEKIPVFLFSKDNSKPLHSTVDPKREAERLVSTIINNGSPDNDTGFIVFLGLGGGFTPQAALEQTQAQVLVIDFCINDTADLFYLKDYTKLLNNERFTLLIDPSNDDIKNFLLDNYRPAVDGSIKTIPLRTRTEFSPSSFNEASGAIQEAIDIISSDYSVQAHFGRRWFSNIIRNIKAVNSVQENLLTKKFQIPVSEAAIAAAGPSLNKQLNVLCEYKSRKVFIISSDTALPVLLHNGIEPDAVVSIDCQHISYYHFIGLNLRNIPLILDIASPPLLSSFTPSPCFFSSGHPLALYISQYWRSMPQIDTSGANVTYACLSLAEYLGAQRITLFGADFSYVNSETYARGTYIYPYFEKKQNRLTPMEALFSSFLYRSPFLPSEHGEKKNYYETQSLCFYRKKLEEKAAAMNAHIVCAKGNGAPVKLPKTSNAAAKQMVKLFQSEKSNISGIDFLEQYRGDIAALSTGGKNNEIKELNGKNRQLFFTLLPYAAAIKYRHPELKGNDLIEHTKYLCINDINRVLASP